VVQAVGGAPTLVEGVRALGWQVERLDTHESIPRVLSGREQLEVLRADAVAFTSGSQARAWAAVLGSATPPVVVAIGPQTAADTHAAGLSVTAVAVEHSVEGLIGTLIATLRAE
jgi:uroporphyrinogen-III synthase